MTSQMKQNQIEGLSNIEEVSMEVHIDESTLLIGSSSNNNEEKPAGVYGTFSLKIEEDVTRNEPAEPEQHIARARPTVRSVIVKYTPTIAYFAMLWKLGASDGLGYCLLMTGSILIVVSIIMHINGI